jgi:hypothetical protein
MLLMEVSDASYIGRVPLSDLGDRLTPRFHEMDGHVGDNKSTHHLVPKFNITTE